MSIPRISGYESSRAADLAMFFREYSDLADSSAVQAPLQRDNLPPQSAPVKAIDNPQRGTRSFFSRTVAVAENHMRNKRDQGKAGDVVQGDIPLWSRMAAEDYPALEAIPGVEDSENLLHTDKTYMRRLGDVCGDSQKSRSASETQAPTSKRDQPNWLFGMKQALRARAQFERMHVLFDASDISPLRFDFP